MALKIAIVGDIHMQFNEADVAYFNTAAYDLMLFVGDFVDQNPAGLFKLLPQLNALQKPVYLILGNHDTTGILQLAGEVLNAKWLSNWGYETQLERFQQFQQGLTSASLCGYSVHDIDTDLQLVAARPFSMGGGLNFQKALQYLYQVNSISDSIAKLKSLIETTQKPYLLLAHHGPKGLGSQGSDIFGADFLPKGGDWGDEDLYQAILYAKQNHHPPLAVIAGHMHYPTKHGNQPRCWFVQQEGILYINAARWPRIFSYKGKEWHHYVELQIQQKACQVFACYWSGDELQKIADPLLCYPN